MYSRLFNKRGELRFFARCILKLFPPRYAIVTYNSIPKRHSGIYFIKKVPVLFLPKTFPKKGPENITAQDKNFRLLQKYRKSFRSIIVFAGKKESGALEIIELFHKTFSDRPGVLRILLCDHNLQEKKELLIHLGIPPAHWKWFGDNYTQCKEAPWLEGWLLEELKTLRR